MALVRVGVGLYQYFTHSLSVGLEQLQLHLAVKHDKMVSLKTCIVAGIQYLIHPHKLGTITATINPDSILPVTLMTTEEIFGGNLEQNLAMFAAMDDVFIPDFGFVLVEKVYGNNTNTTTIQRASLDQSVYTLHTTAALVDMTKLPSGPYILHGPNLYQAWRLYEDEHEAFTTGVIPEDVFEPDLFRPLNSLSTDGAYRSVGVPSRLYFPEPSLEKPLSGVRFSISDATSLKGVPITMSSRAWSSLYPYGSSNTAAYASKLMNLGAVIVGKTKVSQFASGAEWVDEKAPWNPRGDGYQDASGSAAGAASAMGSYSWLAFAAGEDSVGGFRSPGAQSGVYTLRPTFTNATLSGAQTSSTRLDAMSLSAREMDGLLNTTEVVLGSSSTRPAAIRELVYFSDFDEGLPKEQIDRTTSFLQTIEKYLGAKAKRIVLHDLWSSNNKSDANSVGLQEYIGDALFRAYCYELYHEYDDFREAYSQRYNSQPFLEKTTKFKWEFGANVTEGTYASDSTRIKMFQAWFNKNIFSEGNNTGVILPYGRAEPHYRQDNPEDPKKLGGLTPDLFSSVLGVPHLIVPFSQLRYASTVSGKSEYLPVSASIFGPSGSDSALIQLVKGAFEQAQWPTSIKVGKTAFNI